MILNVFPSAAGPEGGFAKRMIEGRLSGGVWLQCGAATRGLTWIETSAS